MCEYSLLVKSCDWHWLNSARLLHYFIIWSRPSQIKYFLLQTSRRNCCQTCHRGNALDDARKKVYMEQRQITAWLCVMYKTCLPKALFFRGGEGGIWSETEDIFRKPVYCCLELLCRQIWHQNLVGFLSKANITKQLSCTPSRYHPADYHYYYYYREVVNTKK